MQWLARQQRRCYAAVVDVVFLIGRILTSLILLFMGLNHFMNAKELIAYATRRSVPVPTLSVPLTGLMLVLGAVAVSLGIYAFVGLVLWVVFLLLTALIVHLPRPSDQGQERMNELVQFTKNMALAGLALALMPGSREAWPLALNVGV